jgi:hypothetical protein
VQTDILRPVSVRKTGAGVAIPAGTLATVTADNSDATYIDFDAANSGNNWSLRVGSHTPPADHGRHRIRGRIRARSDAGTVEENIDLGRGTSDYIEYDLVSATSVFTDLPSSWHQNTAFGLADAGALTDLNIGGGWVDPISGGGTELRTAECYVDIDCRAIPDYDAEVRDNAGVDQSGGIITDTNQPVFYFGTVAYDGLPALDWSITLTSLGTPVFNESGSGAPPTQVLTTTGLPDGAYSATFRVRSTIRGVDPFQSVQVIAFSIQNTVPPPSPPNLEVVREGDGYRVTWTNPGGQEWDNDYVVAELWRADCTGEQRIATVPDGLNGTYLDLAIPQLDPLSVQTVDGCEIQTEPCDITYSIRYWGYVSTFVELPDTIPDGMILGWPGTAVSIPSGWTRVTSLDARYPLGATGIGAPVTTGGATGHSHTMAAAHGHTIGAHSHSVGGSTGTSSSSTTSARYNGASQPQADQPHSHTRPANTVQRDAVFSGLATPGTASADNLPLTREVIWIESDGTPAQYPVGVLGWATEAVSGWDTDALSAGRFLKGAAAAGNGGAQIGAATHQHFINAHDHTGVNHDHAISNTGLSNPSSSQEAGTGASTPRWLPRHTHPMDVVTASTGNTGSSSGGLTGLVSLDPLNRRLRVLRNTGGGTQTRIIGLWLGTVASIDPTLTLCNGSNGTPDMRAWFARDAGSDSIGSTGGASTHIHTGDSHTHAIGGHSHDTNVGVSGTGSYERPTSGDLGDSPTTGHTHSSGSTGSATPSISSVGTGSTDSQSLVPPYHEAHFVRLDGTISGGPLAVPELRVTDFATATVPSFTYGDDLDRLANLDGDQMAVATDRSHAYPRLVADSVPLDGGLHTVSTTLAGEDMSLSIAVEGILAINALESLLSADRVYFSPVGGTPGWYAPAGWVVRAPVTNVKVLQVNMVRQPWPDTAEPGDYL